MSIWPGQKRLRRPSRPSFTLAELLVVIAIIGVVASMTLFAFHGVREDARERRARAQVAKIHELIMRKWESYRTRPVAIDRRNLLRNPEGFLHDRNAPEKIIEKARDRKIQVVVAWVRLAALRELMRKELPDRKADVTRETRQLPAFLASQPAVWESYRRRATPFRDWSEQNEEAECLYLILATMRDGDTTGLDFFSEDEIGDIDGDGMPEILDPWGVPIRFLRWAPGFRSDIQPGPGDSGDLIDPLRVDPDGFALYPLIVSAGRDGEFHEPGWAFDPHTVTASNYDDPYSDARAHLGSQGPFSSDNITNHFLEVR